MKKAEIIGVAAKAFLVHDSLQRQLESTWQDVRYCREEDLLNQDAVKKCFQKVDRAIVSLQRIDSEFLESCPNLKVISKYGVGLDNIDLEACDARGILVGWEGGVNAQAVAELTIGLLIDLARTISLHSNRIKNGKWSKIEGFQLDQMTVGLLGFGHVGKRVAKILKPFGSRILAHDIRKIDRECEQLGVRSCSFSELLLESDAISIHLPKTMLTAKMISSAEFEKMKPQSFLINTARGGIVDEKALADALRNKKLSGAAFDVFQEEPIGDSPLIKIDEFIATPHIGGNTKKSVILMGEAAIRNLSDPKNVSQIRETLGYEL